MAKLLAYPVRLSGSSFATVEDGDDACYAQELAILVQTDPGERTLAPEYGFSDPTFDEFSRAELEAKIFDYGPPVRISEFEVTRSNGRLDVRVQFENDTPEDSEAYYDDNEDAVDPIGEVVTDATEGI